MALLLIQTDGTIWMLVVLLIIGWAATYITARQMLKRAIEDLRREMDERIGSLQRSIQASLAAEVDKASAAAAASTAPKPEAAPASPTPSESLEKHPEVSPDVLVMIAAAATAFLGKKVRIRSAEMLQTPYELVNPWVQQGRVVVQASHNLSPRGH